VIIGYYVKEKENTNFEVWKIYENQQDQSICLMKDIVQLGLEG
jgi:hypothetical protein